MSDSLAEIADYCFDQLTAQAKRPLFAAIAGDSGSGKSFFVDLITQRFEETSTPYVVINHDDFLISRADREPMKSQYYTEGEFAGKSHWEVLENMFRLDEYEKVIAALRAGRCIKYHAYSRKSGQVSEEETEVCPADFILFDTSMMLDKMDYTILIDVTQDNIIKRKLVRDSDVRTPEQITEMHKKVQGYYWERSKPKSANIVIDNNDFERPRIVKA